jgi:Xaa-Pro aminopeptidase
MLANGADGFAFDIIVLTGGNAAKPHGIPGETRLVAGAPLLIDFGASYQGYSADITRTVFCENIKDEYAEIYEAVLSANIAGRNMAAPSVTCHELDLKVSNTLHNAGFEELTVHKTGHGLGLDIHEAPNVMLNNHTSLETGMLITIEPGLYRSNDIGVRIEDDVLITDDGCKSLTSFEREPLIVGK